MWTKASELDGTAALNSIAKDTATTVGQLFEEARAGRQDGSHLTISKNPIARQYLEAGREYFSRYRQEDTNTALIYFEKAIATDPECASAQAMYSLAAVTQARQSSQNDREAWAFRAEAAANRAVQLDPNLALAHRALSVCETYQGRLHEALESSLKAIELDPADTLASGTIAYTLRQSGRPDLAIKWFRRCASRAQRPGIYAAAIGDSFYDLGDDAMAEQAYKEAAEFCPDLPDGKIGLAHLRLTQKDFDAARKLSHEALTAFPEHPYPLAMLAQVEMFAGNFSIAAELYRQLVERDRFGGNSFYGGISYLAGMAQPFRPLEFDEARARMIQELITRRETDLSTAPRNPSLLYDLSAAYCVVGELERAIELLQTAIANGWIDYRSASQDPRFEQLRQDERFQDLLKRQAAFTEELRRQRPAGKLVATP
jgi:tetratricopeptide (TPR) repeat protein